MRHGYNLPRVLLARSCRLLSATSLKTPLSRVALQEALNANSPASTAIQIRSKTSGATYERSTSKKDKRDSRPKKKNGEWRLRKQAVGQTFADILYRKDTMMDAAIDAFPAALPELSQEDQREYIESIKNAFNKGQIPKEKLSTAVKDIATALMNGKLEYDPSILEKSLHFCRRLQNHQGALELWQWAREVGKPLTLGVYSTMIQIVTDEPIKMNLEEIETIYQEAIANDGGPFADYYLSNNAILGDRTSDAVAGQLNLRALHLLSAIARARLLNGNWQDGYLAYDSMCRLSPSRPTLFYQAMVSKDAYRPIPEIYRIVRAAQKEGIELNPWPRNRLIPRLFTLIEPFTQKIETNAQLLVIIRIISSLVDLIVSQPDSKYIGPDINKILTLLLNLTDRYRLPNAANHSSGQEYTSALATAGQEFLQAFTSLGLITGNGQIAHTMVMKLAINANNSEIFQSTLTQLLLERGETPNADVAQALVEAAGRFGTFDVIKPAWNELVSIRKETQGKYFKMSYWDLSALRSAISNTPTDEALQFLLAQCKKHSFPNLALLKHQDKETPSTLDLPGAQKLITSIFTTACKTLSPPESSSNQSDKTTTPKSSSPPVPSEHTTSLTHQPLAPPELLYTLYDTLTSENPTQTPLIPYTSLDQHPILYRRFLDWCTSTSLLADAELTTRLTKVISLKRLASKALVAKSPISINNDKPSTESSKSSEEYAAREAASVEAEVFTAFLMAGVDGQVRSLDRLEGSPRFGDLDELGVFVRRVRGMDGTDKRSSESTDADASADAV